MRNTLALASGIAAAAMLLVGGPQQGFAADTALRGLQGGGGSGHSFGHVFSGGFDSAANNAFAGGNRDFGGHSYGGSGHGAIYLTAGGGGGGGHGGGGGGGGGGHGGGGGYGGGGGHGGGFSGGFSGRSFGGWSGGGAHSFNASPGWSTRSFGGNFNGSMGRSWGGSFDGGRITSPGGMREFSAHGPGNAINHALNNPGLWQGNRAWHDFGHFDHERDFGDFHHGRQFPFFAFGISPFFPFFVEDYFWPYAYYPWRFPYYDYCGFDYYLGAPDYGDYGYAAGAYPAAPVQYAANPGLDEPQDASAAEQFLTGARSAFARKQYTDALRLVSHAALEMPRSAKVHELISVALFALQDYRGANLEAHAALAMGHASDWPTLYAYYGDLDTYTNQYDALVKFVHEHPDAADARFVLAYHFLMMGHREAAKEQLEKVVAAVPKDKLAADLLKELGGSAPPAKESTTAEKPAADNPPSGEPSPKPAPTTNELPDGPQGIVL